MAKRSRKSQAEPDPETLGLDEVDAFAEAQEKILLDQAGDINRAEEESSDEEHEVMDIDENDSEDEAEIERYRRQLNGGIGEDEEEYFGNESGEEDEEEDEEGWGQSEFYGADEAQDEDEEEILKESKRLQRQHLEALSMDDYMVDEMIDDWKTETKQSEGADETQKADEKVDFSTLDDEGKLSVLKSAYPEFLPLTKELNQLKPLLDQYQAESKTNEVAKIKYTALSAYIGTITTYFAIFVGYLNSGSEFNMKEEPVMAGILTTREIWRQAKELPDELPEIDESEDDQDIRSMHISESESDEELEEDEESLSNEEELEDEEEEEDDEEIDFSKKREIKKLKSRGFEDTDDIDIEDKKGRRKTLRFYTSKIDQQENKKDAKFQGDQDLPYKERLFEKQQRLLEEAKKRGDIDNASAPGLSLGDNNDLDAYPGESRTSAEKAGDKDDDYYNSILNKKQNTKAARKDAHMAAVRAAREGKLGELEEALDGSGKRALNYQIMKNKGLTKSKKKEDRNARVKKRKKYAKAQIKLKSVRAVYQGGQDGAYAGEATGIKKNLSRAVKLV